MALTSPIHLEYFSGLTALGLFALLAIPVVLLGHFSLNGLGRTRKWVAICARLLLILGIVLLLGGIRWQRQHTAVEVMVLRDLSDSTSYVKNIPAPTVRESVNTYLQELMADKGRKPEDRIGVIGFANRAIIETLPSTRLDLGARAVAEGGNGTDVASAIQLALATQSNDAMHRLLLVWDGNQTVGNIQAAIEAAASQHVPIDVMPLHYRVDSAVMMDRFVAPTWRRENEPMTLDVVLRSNSEKPVTGTLVVLHHGQPIDLDAETPGVQGSRKVTLRPAEGGQPGITPVRVKVPALSGGIHAFRAAFEPDVDPAVPAAQKPTLVTGAMDAFTIVEGRGSLLFIDNTADHGSDRFIGTLRNEGIDVDRGTIDDLPRDLFALQNYDAIIMANVPSGAGGVDEQQDKAIAAYVHDMGGGLVMIGGPDTFGAGGWQGTSVEKVLPVNMDVPARKEVGKGALVMIVHACEFENGNYWGEQCAIKAVDALSQQDEVGVVSFDWSKGGSQWDFPLQTKGDGNKAKAAIKQMKVGDMPSFEDSMKVALYGSGGQKGLKDSDARHKHVVIISDGDPQSPSDELMAAYKAAKVSVSTVAVYPHDLSANGLPPTMRKIAETLKGRAYGPVNGNFNQLPQIFIKEATIVRRTLIHENSNGIPTNLLPSVSDVTQGLATPLPQIYGLVLTSRKPDPMVDMPITAGKAGDPLFAQWQSGLGKSAVFTSDVTAKWTPDWMGSSGYGKFWAQVIRSVARAPMSRDMDIQTRVDGDKIYLTAEAMDREQRGINFLNVTGQVMGPDMKPRTIQLNQTGPGRYEAVIEKAEPGAYVARIQHTGPKGEAGWQVAGVAVNSNPEMRDLRSNDGVLEQIAAKTGGRMLDPFDAAAADVFRREGLLQTASPMPVWDILLPILMGLLLVDVAIRRIAWNLKAVRGAAERYADTFRSHRVEKSESVNALRRLREGGKAEAMPARPAPPPPPIGSGSPETARPDPKRKFEGTGVQGDLTQVVGGATAEAPRKPDAGAKTNDGTPGAGAGEHTSSLLAAKRRAREQIEKKERENP